MPRKPDLNLPEEELQGLDENTVTPKELAEKYDKKRSYFDNLKHKRKMKSSFSLNVADQSIQGNDMKAPEQVQPTLEHQAPVINYHMAVKGLYKGADSIFKVMAVLSKGQIEYTPVDDKQLEDLTSITENDPMVQKVSTLGGVSTIVTVGSIVATFGGQFKIIKKVKHNPQDPNCKCKNCLALLAKFEEIIPKDEQITDITNVKVLSKEEQEATKTEKLGNEIKNALKEEPKTTASGMIIEKNIIKDITPEQVIKNNSGATE